jgi:hypothetical protein
MFLFEGLSPYGQLHSLISCGTIRTSRTPIATEEASLFDPLSLTSFACIGWKQIACGYAGLIEKSVCRVYITTLYFSSGSILARAARQPARRGVEVRLLVARCSNPPFVGWLTRSGYTSLLAFASMNMSHRESSTQRHRSSTTNGASSDQPIWII